MGLYLLKVVNPKVDYFIDWIKIKFKNTSILKALTLTVIILLFINCVISGYALDSYLTRTIIENNLEVDNKEEVLSKYNYTYKENENLSNFIYTLWGNNKMVKTYPNVTIRLSTGEDVPAKKYYPDIKPYFFKFRK